MAGFQTRWTVAGDATARTITLPLYNAGTFNCTVSWGDGSADSTITSYNDADRIHTYALDGTYDVTITGECPSWSFANTGDKLKITDVLDWGSAAAPAFGGFAYLQRGFSGCANLASIGSTKILPKGTSLTSLYECFYLCPFTTIPTGFFDNCVNLSTNGFKSVFERAGITSIPVDLFKYNTAVSTSAFHAAFYYCSGITSIPTDLFRYNTAVSSNGFNIAFCGCQFTTLPVDIFRYNTGLTDYAFSEAFKDSAITTLPDDIFRYNTAISSNGFHHTFRNCTDLATLPANLFKYNVLCTGFSNCFYGCNKLQQHATIFYAAGEQSTRFAGKTVDFTSCFERTTFSGTQGTAPDLWNCTFTASTKTNCWAGLGNSDTSLTNYRSSIPLAWGAIIGFRPVFTVAGDATARTVTLPLYNSGTFNCTVDWGDGTALSTITSYNDADRIHVYASDGTYTLNVVGECPSWSFNDGGDKLKISSIYDWGRSPDFGGFAYLFAGFMGCSNLTSLGSTKILPKGTSLVKLQQTFFGCSSLTAIPTGIFDNCLNLTAAGFASTFHGCTGITTIPTDLFKYNTAVSSDAFYNCFLFCSGITGAIPTDLFRYNTSVGSQGFFQTFYGCTGITTIPTDLFRYNTSVAASGFYGTFNGCAITTVPTDLFRYNTSVSTLGFRETFKNCTSLTSLPIDIFRYNTAVSTDGFESAFRGSGLTTVPTDLFKYNINLSGRSFYLTFADCTSLASIPTDLFRYNTSVGANGFNACFYLCAALAAIPADTFKYNTSVTTDGFRGTFIGCTSLTTVPTDLFRYNTGVSASGFRETFYGCTALETVPENLFKYNASNLSFYQTFYGCNKMQQHATIFYAAGEQSTRFAGKTIDFTECFYRTSFTGTQGTAPDLWACTFTASTKTNCWAGAGNIFASLTNYIDIPSAWGVTIGFMTEWTVSGTGTDLYISLPLALGGTFNCTVYWGDGTNSTITSYTDSAKTHVYAESGTYIVNIVGLCPSISFWSTSWDSDLKITDIIHWGRSPDFGGFQFILFSNPFEVGCVNLKSLGIGKILVSGSSLVALTSLFNGCVGLTGSIPTGLFDNCVNLTTYAYYQAFKNCPGLTGSIPTDLFKYSTSVTIESFYETFYGCIGLSGAIPTDLFRYNTSISSDGFFRTFRGCTGLSGAIPTDLFRYNTLLSTEGFRQTFYDCTGLSGAIPTDLFRYNVNVSSLGFESTFYNCAGLTTTPQYLFKYNTLCTSFYKTFYGCNKLQQNADIFYDSGAGESATRFLNKSVDFTSCFERTSFSGTQGTAPDLWNCSYGTGTPTKTDCWKGAGNSLTSLINYNDIPLAWGGTYVSSDGFKTAWLVAGDAAARTISLPFTDHGVYNCTVTWGDLTADSTITTYDDADRIHTYASDGTYTVVISGEAPGWSFNGVGDCLKIINILDWGTSTDFGGFSNLTAGFKGCINLISTGVIGNIQSKNDLTDLSELFSGCTSLSSIASGVFDECIYLTANGFKQTFYGCTGITSIPSLIFDYNVDVSSSGFEGTFSGCTGLTSVTANIFDNCVDLSTSGFKECFKGCTGLTAIDANLFENNVLVSTNAFESTFEDCLNLATIPADLFSYNVAVSSNGFDKTFKNCVSLVEAPELLFQNNILCTGFNSTFYGCNKLQQNVDIFYDSAAGESATRFYDLSVDFTTCFFRTSFTGTQGVAPDLWDCDYGSGTPTKTNCWYGPGNSLNSLTNYNDIPFEWGGPAPVYNRYSKINAYGTWEWWQKVAPSSETIVEFISNSVRNGYLLRSDAGAITLELKDISTLISGGTYTDDTWTKIKINRSASGIFKLWVNDILVGTSTSDLTTTNSSNIIITMDEGCKISLADPNGNHALVKKIL